MEFERAEAGMLIISSAPRMDSELLQESSRLQFDGSPRANQAGEANFFDIFKLSFSKADTVKWTCFTLLTTTATLLTAHRIQLDMHLSSVAYDCFGILVGFLISQRAQSAVENFAAARGSMATIRGIAESFAFRVQDWILTNERYHLERSRSARPGCSIFAPEQSESQEGDKESIDMMREVLSDDFPLYLFYKYQLLCIRSAKDDKRGLRTWNEMLGGQAYHSFLAKLSLSGTKDALLTSEYNANTPYKKAGLLRTMMLLKLQHAKCKGAREMDDIEAAFRHAESLGGHARTKTGLLMALMTNWSVLLLTTGLPPMMYHSWGVWGAIPIFTIMVAFSSVNSLAKLAENPFGNDSTDINLMIEFISCKETLDATEDQMKRVESKLSTLAVRKGDSTATLLHRSSSTSGSSRGNPSP